MKKNRLLGGTPEHHASLPMEWHDISRELSFTSSTGHILPLYHHPLNAGEKVKFNMDVFARSNPLIASPMADVEMKIYSFFVPMQMLFTLFGDVRYNVDDRLSSLYSGDSVQRDFPKTNFLHINPGNAAASRLIVDDSLGAAAIAELGPQYTNYFDCQGKERFRLLWHLGYNPYRIYVNSQTGRPVDGYEFTESVNMPYIFPYAALAYQAIYQKHFRLEERERYDVDAFNVDKYWNDSSDMANYLVQQKFLQMRYHPRHSDYFTQIKVNPLISGVNALYQNSTDVTYDTGWPDPPYFNDGQDTFFDSRVGTSVDISYSDRVIKDGLTQLSRDQVSTAGLRRLFANEKLLRITGKAGKNYDSQVLAHFGFKVPKDVKHDLTFIGCDSAIFHFGEVTSTSDTYTGVADTGAVLGEIAGKGYLNLNGRKREFTAPVDGVFMVLSAFVPRFSYDLNFEKINAIVSKDDFFTPEYDHLGMQPVFSYEVNPSNIGTSNILGWQYGYQQFKKRYNKVSPAFLIPKSGRSVNIMSCWLLGRKPLAFRHLLDQNNNPIAEIVPYWNFLSSPEDLNSIMVTPYDTSWNEAYYTNPFLMFQSDPFIVQSRMTCFLHSTMSKTSEPRLD